MPDERFVSEGDLFLVMKMGNNVEENEEEKINAAKEENTEIKEATPLSF